MFLFSNGPKSGITGRFSTCFSSLDGRKAAKEDQGLTEAGEVGRVYDMISLEKVPGKTSLPRKRPSLDGRKAAKEDQGLTEAGEVGRVYT